MLKEFSIKTEKENFYDITGEVHKAVKESGVKNGICIVYCPHTTAGITVNENADPDVISDILKGLNKAFPDLPEYRHSEGNSACHVKCSYIGTDKTLIIQDGKLILGVWQSIFFCEFDGPRTRKYYVKVIEN